MIKKNKNNSGFTVIELLVSIAILGIFISLIFGTIHYLNKVSESASTNSDISNNYKNFFETMVLNIKSFDINYSYYRTNGNNYNIPKPTNILSLNNNIFYRKTNNCFSNFSCVEVSFDNGNTYKRLTDSDTNITNLDFYFSAPDINHSMPIITIVMSGFVKDKHDYNHYFSYQNTVELKKYIK